MSSLKQIVCWTSLLLLLTARGYQSFGQQLLWERKIPLSTYEWLSCIAKCSDGGYLAFGSSDRWLYLNPVIGGAILMRFNENGDTLWTKWTGKFGGFSKVIKGEDGLLYALMAWRDTVINKFVWGIYVLTEDGIVITNIPLDPGDNATLVDMEYRHGYFWLSGEKMPSLFHPSGLTFDFLLMKLRMDGSEVFSYVYNAGDPTSRGRKMEFMPNGNILFSGQVGNKIGAFEIDTAGNQVQYRTYFTNPLNGGWQGSSVVQIADGNQLISGYRSTSPVSYYLGKHDTSGVRIWGGIRPGAVNTTLPNLDTSVIVTYSDNFNNTFISRIRGDSTYMWSVNIFGTAVQGYKYPYDVAYSEDESGILVGAISPANFSYQNLYICKFGGLGIPFDPTSAKAFETLKTDAVPLAFPNPGTDVVRFTMLAGPGKVHFTDMQGRKVLEGEYLPEKGINTKSLPAGIYNYTLERNGKVWMGKWVKAP